MQPRSAFCITCGNALAPGARFCARCGANVSAPAAAPGFVQGAAYGGPGGQATVTATFAPAVLPQAPGNQIPEELLARWTWGPFWATPLWAFWNADTLHKVLGVVLLLAAWLSGGIFAIVLFGYGIYLGFRGNRIAAANRRFASLNEFLAVQRAWSMWGFIAFLVQLVLIGIVLFFLLFLGVLAALVAH